MSPFVKHSSSPQKEYEVYSAIEQTKIMIIQKLNAIYDNITFLMNYKMLGLHDAKVQSLLKANVMSLFLFMKPKIKEHVDGKKSNYVEYRKLLTLNDFVFNPSKLGISQVLTYVDLLNGFCHHYGVTRITYFAGTSGGGGSVSKGGGTYSLPL